MFVSDLNIRALANSHALFALLVCVQLIEREREFARKIPFILLLICLEYSNRTATLVFVESFHPPTFFPHC